MAPHGDTWAQITGLNGTVPSNSGCVISFAGHALSGWSWLIRYPCVYDTTVLRHCFINSAILRLLVDVLWDGLACNPTFNFYECLPTNPMALDETDYNKFGNAPLSVAGIDLSAIGASQDVTLSPFGLTKIKIGSITTIGIRNSNYDVAGVEPPWASGEQSFIVMQPRNDPQLIIDYTPQTPSKSYCLSRKTFGDNGNRPIPVH